MQAQLNKAVDYERRFAGSQVMEYVLGRDRLCRIQVIIQQSYSLLSNGLK